MSFTRERQSPRSQAEFVLDLRMPRMAAGAAVTARDRGVPFNDALGGHLFAAAARGALVRRAPGFRLFR
jgi:hypothetical protein